jgi:hypothetical protein
MLNIKRLSLSIFVGALVGVSSIGQANELSPMLEKKLVRVCEAIQSNDRLKLRRAIKDSGVSKRQIVKGLVCNGMDGETFALSMNATVTAELLASNKKSSKQQLASKS